MIMKKLLIQAGCLAALATAFAVPASAIECQGDFQVQANGARIATPYCQDNHLARVARQQGFRVSSAAIRNDPEVKAEACRVVGDDNRVRETCDSVLQPPTGNEND
jgi:hypothetical protein